jgi:hypothetical protein
MVTLDLSKSAFRLTLKLTRVTRPGEPSEYPAAVYQQDVGGATAQGIRDQLARMEKELFTFYHRHHPDDPKSRSAETPSLQAAREEYERIRAIQMDRLTQAGYLYGRSVGLPTIWRWQQETGQVLLRTGFDSPQEAYEWADKHLAGRTEEQILATTIETHPPGYDWGDRQIPFEGKVTPGYVVALKAYRNRTPPLAASGRDTPIGTSTQWKKEVSEETLRAAGWVVLRGQTVPQLLREEPDYILQDLIPWMAERGIGKLLDQEDFNVG